MIVFPGIRSQAAHLPFGQKFMLRQPRQLSIQVAPGTDEAPMRWVAYNRQSINFSDRLQVQRLNNWRTTKIREDRIKRNADKGQ